MIPSTNTPTLAATTIATHLRQTPAEVGSKLGLGSRHGSGIRNSRRFSLFDAPQRSTEGGSGSLPPPTALVSQAKHEQRSWVAAVALGTLDRKVRGRTRRPYHLHNICRSHPPTHQRQTPIQAERQHTAHTAQRQRASSTAAYQSPRARQGTGSAARRRLLEARRSRAAAPRH